MSFFELDGGAKKNARKSTKPKAKPKAKATKKTPTKKTKKTKKGGNFLGTVSELFAPAGWENFVTAAGLLALDRTDNYLRKSKDSKKQKGGADDTPKMEEEMTGGARKKSSSRKQRGGSDGHHTVEYLDAVGGEEQDVMSQTGGAKKRSKSKGKGIKQSGGALDDNQKINFLKEYISDSHMTNTNKNKNSERRILTILESMSISPNDIDTVNEVKKLIRFYNQINTPNFQYNSNRNRVTQIIEKAIQNASQPNTGSIFNSPASNFSQGLQTANISGQQAVIGKNMGTSAETNLNQSIQQQALVAQKEQALVAQKENELFGGKKSKSKSKSKAKSSTKKSKSKAKSSTKKPKAKKAPKKK
jgi:hypothetical protein